MIQSYFSHLPHGRCEIDYPGGLMKYSWQKVCAVICIADEGVWRRWSSIISKDRATSDNFTCTLGQFYERLGGYCYED